MSQSLAQEASTRAGRVGFLDVSKLVVMYLVIWSHTVQYALENSIEHQIFHPYSYVIQPFFMSLFMMLSGVFASSTLKRTFFPFVWGKFKQLVIPAFLWTSVAVAVLFVRGKNWFVVYSIWDFIVVDYWFVKCLFLCYLLFWCSIKLFRSEVWACIVSVLLVLIFPQGETIFLNSMYPYFWLGHFLRNWLLKGRCYWSQPLIFGILYVVLFMGWSKDYSMYFNNYNPISVLSGSISGYNTFVMLYRFVMGLFGSLFVVTLVKVLYPKVADYRVTKWMERYGKETYGIYMMHVMTLVVLSWIYVVPEGTEIYLFDFVYAHGYNILTLFICMVLIELFNRFKLTRALLLGKW